jgi:hypothetical protein
MTARIETLRAPSRQVSPWIVIGTAAALVAALAVLTTPEPKVAPVTGQPAVSTVRVTDDVAEIAALKSAVAHRYMVERFGVGESVSSSSNEATEIWRLKSGIVRELLARGEGPGSGPREGHPVRRSG